jgi:hypothetical protein
MTSVFVGLEKAENRNGVFASCFGFQSADQRCLSSFIKHSFDIAAFPESEIALILGKVTSLLKSKVESYQDVNKSEAALIRARLDKLSELVEKNSHQEAIREAQSLFYGFPAFIEHFQADLIP